ncbi:hypothetical protein K7X08_036643 [Anisodus acutangulus]|uniref:Fatty acyl-CoA reductase n=1 Tax=Anisodus acutangulus TaxID=402998 RepID=A0A9Q1L5P2_9SOLA|nr:hypothetical protein K7X08_036643 [Anisodus acutangulus]
MHGGTRGGMRVIEILSYLGGLKGCPKIQESWKDKIHGPVTDVGRHLVEEREAAPCGYDKREDAEDEVIKRICLEFYPNLHGFIEDKVFPVPGDIAFDSLGINSELKDDMCREIDIIVNSAATTRFDERYDTAIRINTLGANCQIFQAVSKTKDASPCKHRTVDTFIVGYGKGNQKVAMGDRESIADMIPADMVVNSIIAAMAAHQNPSSHTVVYYISSSRRNQLKTDDIIRIGVDYFKKNLWIDERGKQVKVKKFHPLDSMASLHKYIAIHCMPSLKVSFAE